ncbi:MAG: copper-binding protein [Bdellovibrionales bacterium]|nr:copper-binding protein [Bdellovibrionales bacterium]
MKSLLLFVSLFVGQTVFASTPPAGFPLVKGLVRKIDVAGARISLKHEEIPNLSMPGMTMSFVVQDPTDLIGLAVGDNVEFAADEINGEITVLWIAKAVAVAAADFPILCTGKADTTPATNVEIEIRENKFSTIRYEIAEGSYKGTAHINSIGQMKLRRRNGFQIYRAGTGPLDSRLVMKVTDGKIAVSYFTNYSAGMKDAAVDCSVEL